MPYYYRFQGETKQAKTWEEISSIVLGYSSEQPAEAIYLYHPVGSEPAPLGSILEWSLERIEAGHPAHIIATKSNKTLWEVTIWTPESA